MTHDLDIGTGGDAHQAAASVRGDPGGGDPGHLGDDHAQAAIVIAGFTGDDLH